MPTKQQEEETASSKSTNPHEQRQRRRSGGVDARMSVDSQECNTRRGGAVRCGAGAAAVRPSGVSVGVGRRRSATDSAATAEPPAGVEQASRRVITITVIRDVNNMLSNSLAAD